MNTLSSSERPPCGRSSRRGTFLLSMAVIVASWILGLAIVPFQGGLAQIDAGTVWSTTFMVYLGVTIFAAFPLIIYAAFIQRERSPWNS